MIQSRLPSAISVPNALSRYYDTVQRALDRIAERGRAGAGWTFHPGYRLPERGDRLDRFFAASGMTVGFMGKYLDRRLALLDLMNNPRTRTTKTFPSLVIVARLVRHIQDTGRRAMIVTPSSGNKATALRDAVLRAIESELVGPDQLQIAVVVPATSRSKLWSSQLDAEPVLRARNPIILFGGEDRAGVKELARAAMEQCGPLLREVAATDLWYTLELDNYTAGDVVRAAFEQEVHPPGPDGRLHVHAVSSAYGLLGHASGSDLLGASAGTRPARYFLVQHLDTPDMVLSLHYGSNSRERIPVYRSESGLYRQDADPRFPATTFDVAECLDTTFYTRAPATSPAMNQIIRAQGGGGIVVSLHECFQRYAEVRELLAGAAVELPRDPRRLREWSLVMAMTGVLNAIDRGLVEDDDILVHGTGSYSEDDFRPVREDHMRSADDADGVRRIVCAAVLGA
jgi:hypothetical protein